MKKTKKQADLRKNRHQFSGFYTISGKKSTTRSNYILFFRHFIENLEENYELVKKM